MTLFLDLLFLLRFYNEEEALVLVNGKQGNIQGVESGIRLEFGESKMAKTRVEMLSQVSIRCSDFSVGDNKKKEDEAMRHKVDTFAVLNAYQNEL